MVDKTEDHIAECRAPTATFGCGISGGDRSKFQIGDNPVTQSDDAIARNLNMATQLL